MRSWCEWTTKHTCSLRRCKGSLWREGLDRSCALRSPCLQGLPVCQERWSLWSEKQRSDCRRRQLPKRTGSTHCRGPRPRRLKSLVQWCQLWSPGQVGCLWAGPDSSSAPVVLFSRLWRDLYRLRDPQTDYPLAAVLPLLKAESYLALDQMPEVPESK